MPFALADAVAAVCRRHAHRSVGLQAGLFLLVVGFDEPVDQVVDVPGLGEPAFGESVAQFGLGQTRVRFPSLRQVLVNPFPFCLPDIPGLFLPDLSGLSGLGTRDLPGVLGLSGGQNGEGIGLVLDDPAERFGLFPRRTGQGVHSSAQLVARLRFRSTVRWTNWKYCSTD
jgi:hypothetical protein